MDKPFIYGKYVEGDNFTDRVNETARLKTDFEHGVNVILMSRRRMGKTSLVRKAMNAVENPRVRTVYMDIYDCRSEYEFLNRYASAILKATASRMEQAVENVKEFLFRLTPRISFSPEPLSDFSLSLGITPQNYQPEEVLRLPEEIARRKDIHLVVCIDEFQQIGEFADTLTLQKRLRGIWQQQQHVSYCLFGSKKHMMSDIFLDKKMPFYMFGETLTLKPIPRSEWATFICSRFDREGKHITEQQALWLADQVECYSSYVQQLAWIVMVNTQTEVTEDILRASLDELLDQSSELFIQQTQGLTTYQLNLLRSITDGTHSGFGQKAVQERYPLGSKSNINRIRTALIDRELIEQTADGIIIPDPVFRLWFARQMKQA